MKVIKILSIIVVVSVALVSFTTLIQEEWKVPAKYETMKNPIDAATDATIIEVRSHDRPALLFGIGDTITRSNIDIRSAIVTTLGAEAIDTLYVTEIGGGPLSPERAEEVATRLRAALK